MAKTKTTKKKIKKAEPVVLIDAVYPLPPGTGIPDLQQGKGGEILRQLHPTRIVELPYRAFYTLWEIAEAKSRVAYPHYKDGPLDHVSDMWLEIITALRSAELEAPLEVFSEQQERKLRKKQNKAGKGVVVAPKPSKNGKRGEAAEVAVLSTEAICGIKHKAPDKKTRKCIRKPLHKGLHKDRKNNRW